MKPLLVLAGESKGKMNWYEQKTNEYESITGKQILKGFGAAGYGAYIILKQIIGQNMNDDQNEWGFVAEIETIASLAEKCGLPEPQFRLFLTFCDERFILEKRNGRLFMPSILEEKNNYIKKVERKNKCTSSTYSTDKVDMNVQDDVTTTITTQSQLQINNKEKIYKKEKYSSITDLTTPVFEQLAQEYSLSVTTIAKKYQDMVDYCQSRGKKYKNYYATLRGWIRRDLESGKLHKVQVFKAPELPELSSEQMAANRELIAQARRSVGI